MGIQNLLPLLENSSRPCNVSEFRGLTVAVDSYCWLHKGARSCALELAKGENTNTYVFFCIKYVKMLLSHDIKPIMVFDGRHLPAKKMTEDRRREVKRQARRQGMDMLRLGQISEACKFFKQCIDVTPDMALAVIKECRKLNVDCIVAPYESDAQLAFFNLKGVAECVISEDSDLLLFGCKKVLYKMDLNGYGQLVEADKLNNSLQFRPDQYSFDKFRYICILSGCDYLDSLPGIGLKKALKFIKMTAEENPEIFLDKLPRYLNMRHLVVTDDYKRNFMIADATFKYQTVFDPFLKKLVPLNPIQTNIEFCINSGNFFDKDQAFQLALGNLDPLNMKQIDDWQPSNNILSAHSIWSNCFTPRPIRREKKPTTEPKINKSKLIDAKLIERVDLERAQDFELELEFYKIKVPVQIESHTEVNPEPELQMSPVLKTYSSNPFIKKKISKFNVTDNDPEQKLVTSKFFNSPSEVSKKLSFENNKTDIANGTIKENRDTHEQHTLLTPDMEKLNIQALEEKYEAALTQKNCVEISDIKKEKIIEDLSPLATVENVAKQNEEQFKEVVLQINTTQNNNIQIHEVWGEALIEIFGSESNDVENIPPQYYEDDDAPIIECECILEVKDEILKFDDESETLASVENIFKVPPPKKMKIECRQTKNKKKQLTINDMFKKMNSKT